MAFHRFTPIQILQLEPLSTLICKVFSRPQYPYVTCPRSVFPFALGRSLEKYRTMKSRILIAVAVIALVGVVIAQEHSKNIQGPAHGQQIHAPEQIKWKDGPASLPAGAKMAVL